MNLPELYAAANGMKCEGPEACHWCGSPCDQTWTHDDKLPIPFVRARTTALKPSGRWICRGCWMFRRPSTTVRFASGGEFKDRQRPQDWSWLITSGEAVALRPVDHRRAYEMLLKPPLRFALALRNGEPLPLHLGVVNDLAEIRTDTQLGFTIGGVRHSYSIYELREALTNGIEGKENGVRALVNFLGAEAGAGLAACPQPPFKPRGAGRPPPLPDGKTIQKLVAASGRTVPAD